MKKAKMVTKKEVLDHTSASATSVLFFKNAYLVVLFFLLCTLLLPFSAADWAFHQGTSLRTGSTASLLPFGMGVKNIYETEKPYIGDVRIGANKIIFSSGYELFDLSSPQVLNAYDLSTNLPEWKTILLETPTADARINDFVYFSNSVFYSVTHGNSLTVGAIDVTTGVISWNNTYTLTDAVYPLISADGSDMFIFYNERLYAYDVTTGIESWSYTFGDETFVGTQDTVGFSVSDGTVYVNAPNYFYSINANTGGLNYRVSLGTSRLGSEVKLPLVANGFAYLPRETTDGKGMIQGVNIGSQAILYEYTDPSFSIGRNLAYSSPLLYYGSGSTSLVALTVSGALGTVSWSATIPTLSSINAGAAHGTIIIAGNSLYVSGQDSATALDKATGAGQWRFSVNNGLGGNNVGAIDSAKLYITGGKRVLSLAFGTDIDLCTPASFCSSINGCNGWSSDGCGILPSSGYYRFAELYCDTPCNACGDGNPDPLEQCDDGDAVETYFSTNPTDDDGYCLIFDFGGSIPPNCVFNVCGDGYLDASEEECDDDYPDTAHTVNATDIDGSCVIDDTNAAASCKTNVCGDGYRSINEECDDATATDSYHTVNAINNDGSCVIDPVRGTYCKQNTCGDGYYDSATEECDDADLDTYHSSNATDNDGACIIDLSNGGAQCKIFRCGDGYLTDGIEECDDADNSDAKNDGIQDGYCIIDPSANSHDCRLNDQCGDGYLNSTEGCDDGNTLGGDGCSATCQIELCGNDVIDSGEQCDDGGTDPTDTHLNISDLDDDGSCIIDPTNPAASCRTSLCGDGYLDITGGEQCDDGNQVSGDGCNLICQNESTLCGDGNLDPGEQCDDGGIDATDDFHLDEATLDDGFCVIDPDRAWRSCVFNVCGDGYLNITTEGCDDGNNEDGDGCDSSCNVHLCGNNILDPGEECDDGINTDNFHSVNGTNDDGYCVIDKDLFGFNSCKFNVCGDGYLNTTSEQCDDGNLINADGCSENCTIEVCGNGIIDAGEECDDGNSDPSDSYHTVYSTEDDGFCVVDPSNLGNSCSFNICGDGYLNITSEQCDDGNTFDGDGCDSSCIIETCGNGVVQTGEVCDDGNIDSDDSYYEINAGDDDGHCVIDANYPQGSCQLNVCGDGYLNTSSEECDDGNTFDGDGCSSICTLTNSICGNNITEPGEQCDDGLSDPSDTFHTISYIDNDGSCIIDLSQPNKACVTNVCGDGYLNSIVEECDDGNLVPGDGCDEFCNDELDRYFCSGGCGDNVTEYGEQCDDGVYGDTFFTINAGNDDGNCVMDLSNPLQSCRVNVCGDGYRDANGGEECDDANRRNNDGCDEFCQLEECGNGVVNASAGEECDDGLTDPHDTYVFTDGTDDDGDCVIDFGNPQAHCKNNVCGDGYLDVSGGEECDDGNTADNDSCSSSCRLEYCGNGIIEGLEQCDDEFMYDSHFSRDSGNDDGPCILDPIQTDNNCQLNTCGDGYLNASSEQCDDGNLINGDGCDSSCIVEEDTCGDGIVQRPNSLGQMEECDDGDHFDTFWNIYAQDDDGNCTIDFRNTLASCKNSTCGDGYLDLATEQCDDGNLIGGDGCDGTCNFSDGCYALP